MKRFISIAFLVVLIDQVSKIYIKTHFQLGESLTVFHDWFDLLFVENPGMAYGMQWGGLLGKIGLAILRWVMIVFIVWFVYAYKNKYTSGYFKVSMALILAGALGNVIDSTFYGLIFDSGTTWNPELQTWNRWYEGVSKLNFKGYSPLFQGCVVDMLHFPLFNYKIPDFIPVIGGQQGVFFSPIFNVADTAISVGGGLLLLFQKKAFNIKH